MTVDPKNEQCEICALNKTCAISVINRTSLTTRFDISGWNCGNFLDYRNVVFIPCEIGNPIYVKRPDGSYEEGKVVDYTHYISCGFCAVVVSDYFNKKFIPFSEFGKTVFTDPPPEITEK